MGADAGEQCLREHKVECELFQSANILCPDEVDDSAYAPITALRLLNLKREQPEIWERLCRLEHHNKVREIEEQELWDFHQIHVVQFLTQKCKLDVTEQEVEEVLGRMFTNCGDLQLPAEGFGRGCGFYPTYANMNHSCICNTKTLKFGSDQHLEVRAQVAIKKGEEISTQYVHSMNATYARRPILRAKWYFDCSCPRCSDPSECGANLAAVACSLRRNNRQCGGKVLPENPLEGDSSWVCEECRNVCTADNVMNILVEVNATMGEVVESEDSIQHWERVLAMADQMLKSSHYLVIQVKEKLAILYGNIAGYSMSEMSRPMKERKVQLCQDMLDVISVVDPGYTKTRGQMLSEMNRTKMTLVKEDIAKDSSRLELHKKRWEAVCLERQFLQMYLAFYQSLFHKKQKK